MHYSFVFSRASHAKSAAYLASLQEGGVPGAFLSTRLSGRNLKTLSLDEFLDALVNTKRPQYFAESQVYGDGEDWNLSELSILGDISAVVPVTVFDDGQHSQPSVHEPPFDGTLVFTPGVLLRNDLGRTPADWIEAVDSSAINRERYAALCERRLLPVLLHINRLVRPGRRGLVTLPGIGCGLFAGQFIDRMGAHLESALRAILTTHAKRLPHIGLVYFDPYNQCTARQASFDGLTFVVNPLTLTSTGVPQLSRPNQFERYTHGELELFSLVAWDHVSWPGNDFYQGSRATDDGVKAAATDAMFKMTGVEGAYDASSHCYLPPPEYQNWEDVVQSNRLQLAVRDNFDVY